MKTFLLLFSASLLLWGCGEKAPSNEFQDIKINNLNTNLKQTQSELAELKSKVSEISATDLYNSFEKIAYLQVGSNAFSPLATEVGTITINLGNIQTYANGSKVTLVFGNPLAATMSDIKFTIDYGTLDKDGSPKNAMQKSKEIKLTQTFQSSTWNNVDVLLEGLPVNELGFVRVHDLTINQIALRRN